MWLSPGSSRDLVLAFGRSVRGVGLGSVGLGVGLGGPASSGGSRGSAPVAARPGCPLPAVGPPLNYSDAVQRYLSLPWSMRRKGARIPSPPKREGDNDARNVTCFASPYVEGGSADTAVCGLESYVYYPTAPAAPATGAPDWSQRKLERCAAMKRGIARQPNSRAAVGGRLGVAGGSEKGEPPFIPVANISCSPEQLCYYPKPLEPGVGGFAEAVNTELGVEVRGWGG